MSVFMQPIYTQTVGAGGANSITFNNIPQGFTDLRLDLSIATTLGSFYAGYGVALNGDGGPRYSQTLLQNTGSYRAVGQTSMAMLATGTSNPAGTFSNNSLYITNYTSGTLKQISLEDNTPNNSSSCYLDMWADTYDSTTPITSITVFGATFVQYTTVTLYGISNTYDTAIPTAPTIGTVTDQSSFAAVAFTPAANDQADSYVVTSTPAGSTTYGQSSPIVTPAVLGTSYTYQVASVNALGTSISAASSALTTANSYASIATFAISSNTSSITFANIPQNYSHLQIRWLGRLSTATDQVRCYFNNDTSVLYAGHELTGNGSAASAANAINQSYIPILGFVNQSGGITNSFGVAVSDILDYTSVSKYKTTRTLTGYDNNGSGLASSFSGMWQSFAPITSITLTSASNFVQYSHFALYGIA